MLPEIAYISFLERQSIGEESAQEGEVRELPARVIRHRLHVEIRTIHQLQETFIFERLV